VGALLCTIAPVIAVLVPMGAVLLFTLRLVFIDSSTQEWQRLFPLRGRWLAYLAWGLVLAWLLSSAFFPVFQLLP
jgi:hypothetical protein